MLSNITWFVTLWTLSASYTPGSRGEHHPLCRTLENQDHQHQTRFPSVYLCHGDKEDAICTTEGAHSTGDGAEKETPGDVTWWVYGGRRQLMSGRAGELSADEWVYCADYCARRISNLGPSSIADVSTRRLSDQMSMPMTKGLLREPRPRAGTSKILRISREPRIIAAEDVRGPSGVKGIIKQRIDFVYAPNEICDDFWLSWPAIHRRAITHGTVVVFDVFASVGNLFLTLNILIKFVRFLELGLILRWTEFPGFREAFDPGEINWDIDYEPFMKGLADTEGGSTVTGLHPMEFRNFAMVLSDSQLELLALTLDIDETSTEALATYFRNELPNSMNAFMSGWMREPLGWNGALTVHPCTWNMLLRRSPSIMASLKKHSPWGVKNDASERHRQTPEYIAWHIRTPDGETARSYNPTVHRYVIQEPSSDVCPTYLGAMEDALQLTKHCSASLSVQADNGLVYISSNSKPMAKDCTVEAANHDVTVGHVDIGLNSTDAHTAYSQTPLKTALSTFLDFFFLLDSTAIVRTGSSFSGTVARMKGLHCKRKVYETLPERPIFLCLPSRC